MSLHLVAVARGSAIEPDGAGIISQLQSDVHIPASRTLLPVVSAFAWVVERAASSTCETCVYGKIVVVKLKTVSTYTLTKRYIHRFLHIGLYEWTKQKKWNPKGLIPDSQEKEIKLNTKTQVRFVQILYLLCAFQM
jgi:hypothetical protein